MANAVEPDGVDILEMEDMVADGDAVVFEVNVGFAVCFTEI